MAKTEKNDRRMILFTFDPAHAWALGEGVTDGREVPPFTHVPPLADLERQYQERTGRPVNPRASKAGYAFAMEHAKETRIKLADGSILYDSEVLCPPLADFEKTVQEHDIEVIPVTFTGRDEMGIAIVKDRAGRRIGRTQYDEKMRDGARLEAMLDGLKDILGPGGDDDLPDGLGPDERDDEQVGA